ncbi:MAG: DnaB-like helicase C-terminal domain-containing protein [Candidatus Humimicrobiaceae bacterium]
MNLEELKQEADILKYIQDTTGAVAKRISPSIYRLDPCPVCSHKDHFTIYPSTGSYHSFSGCIEGGSIIDFMINYEKLNIGQAIDKLCEITGKTLDKDPNYFRAYKEAYFKNDIFKASQVYFREELFKDSGIEGLDYLKSRGYTEEEIKIMGLGYYTSTAGLQSFLVNTINTVNNNNTVNKDNIVKKAKELGLFTEGLGSDYKITIPYKDNLGKIKGYIVRAINKTEPKYKYTYGTVLDNLFNIDRASQKDLIIVEGFLDSLICSARGLNSVVATGRVDITDKQLSNAIDNGFKNFIFALDNDSPGIDGAKKSIAKINQYKKDKRLLIQSYIISLPKGFKDPDELIKAKGIQSFKEAVDKPQNSIKWTVRDIFSRYNIVSEKGLQDAINEAIEYDSNYSLSSLDNKTLLEAISDITGNPIETLSQYFLSYKEKREEEDKARLRLKLKEEAKKLLEVNDIEGAGKLINEKLRNFKYDKKDLGLYGSKELQEDIINTPPGLKTGFNNLDQIISIPQEAITIIGARPSHGKTTFLMNLLLNMLNNYGDKAFLFFSYEETRKKIALKLLNILAGVVIDQYHNMAQFENYIRGKNTSRPKIEKAKEALDNFKENERLFIIDDHYYIDDLCNRITYFKDRYPIGAVFIDYIQKIKIEGKYQLRQVELANISEQILETSLALKLPIILGAQLGRDKNRSDKVMLDNLRESGDIEQDANLVIGLHNEAMEKAQDNNTISRDPIVMLELTILKNRDGIVNEKVCLEFNRPILTLKDKES